MKLVALLVAALWFTQPSSTDAVLARLDEYLAAYEPKLSELIADETMIQDVNRSTPRHGPILTGRERPASTRQRRRLKSEVAFVALPNDAGWLGFRHVKTVNSRTVHEGEMSLSSALRTPGFDAARALLAESAQHNLGLPRTTNLPNLPLEFLHQRNRKRLVPRADGRERVRGIETVRLVFLERMTPTLIRNPNGSDMPSVIRAWVDPASGRLLRAEVSTFASAEASEFENNIRVEFAQSKALGLLVPVEMREVFPVGPPATGSSVANYSNFRRFQTSARIVQ